MIIAAFFFPATDHTTDTTIQLVLGGLMALPISWYFRPAYGGVHCFNGFISNLTPTITGENNDENSIEKKGQRGADFSVPAMDAQSCPCAVVNLSPVCKSTWILIFRRNDHSGYLRNLLRLRSLRPQCIIAPWLYAPYLHTVISIEHLIRGRNSPGIVPNAPCWQYVNSLH